ncbi:MAG: sensor domain-containing diguanylate cyclase, partial [Rivularia sp. (in: cyanobacteria)]
YSDRDSSDGSAGPSAFVLGRGLRELTGDAANSEPWLSHLADLEAQRPFRNFRYSVDLPTGTRHLSSSGRPFFDKGGQFLGYRGVTHDITELEEARRENVWHANHDALTGLSNRRRWNVVLLENLGEDAKTGAVLLLDLDRFKTINDTMGHAVGDALLCKVAQTLLAVTREGDTVARLGGDEFAIFLAGSIDRSLAATIAARILRELDAEIVIDDQSVRASTSIGITLCEEGDFDPDSLVTTADKALYAAKDAGRATYAFAA